MPVATPERLLEMRAKSTRLRSLRRRQRLAFRGLDPTQLAEALINAPPEFASYRLKIIFAAIEDGARGVIPGFGVKRFDGAMAKLRRHGHYWAHDETRLCDLTTVQRRQLVSVVLDFAPSSWSGRTK